MKDRYFVQMVIAAAAFIVIAALTAAAIAGSVWAINVIFGS